MVSSRATNLKGKFQENEKVLCYEPDMTKAKVLYDSKVLEIHEGKDNRGRKILEYLIHFQGWSNSWDRRVTEEFILKDTEANRNLQKELAEKAQLQLGAYLYRRERKKRWRKLSERVGEAIENVFSSEEGSSCDQRPVSADPVQPEPELLLDYNSSVDSMNEERLYLQMGDILKNYLDSDYKMIVKDNRLVNLPARVPIVAILEKYVRYYAMKQVCGISPDPSKSKRRNSQARFENSRQRELEIMKANIELCKEVADGLRIYFDFTIKNYLLYAQEKKQADVLLSPENLKHFYYVAASDTIVPSNITVNADAPPLTPVKEMSGESEAATPSTPSSGRRLRSFKSDDEQSHDIKHEIMSSLSSCSDSTYKASSLSSTNMSILRSALPLNIGVSKQAKELLDEVFNWKLLPSSAEGSPSMIYGAIHFTRLLIKLPDFLGVSGMNDDKLKILLTYLDSVAEFLEAHEEFFCHQYHTLGSDDSDEISLIGSDNERTPRKKSKSSAGSQSENDL